MASSPQQHHQVPTYAVEHLATFSTTSPQQQQTTPRMALQRLFAMEKTSGIWTQRMAIKLKGNHMYILDGESNDIVEQFPVQLIQQPTAFNDHNHIYNNILIFTVQLPNESQGELHIFQCVSTSAHQVVEDIHHWMRQCGVIYNSGPHSEHSSSPTTNVNVKETVNVFNQIAAQREKKGSSPVGGPSPGHGRMMGHHDSDSRSITTTSSIDSNHHNGAHRTNSHEQTLSNERYVSILNHCFDDIERFIIRLQHAAAALRELQLRNHRRQGKGPAHAGDGLLAMRARGPNEEEFFEILSKFKLAFNLLAKLKGCIHDPNAPELVHFLFTPLAIIIEAARSNEPPIDPSIVGVPYLNHEAIELLSNCCTSKEFDLWQSLGPHWTQSFKPNARMSSSYQPVFTDGWAPTITEPELIGIASESEQEDDHVPIHVHREEAQIRRGPPPHHYDDSDIDDPHHIETRHMPGHRIPPQSQPQRRGNTPPSPVDSIERDSPTAIQVNELDQSEWVAELQARNAKIVRVLFPRTANNDKELTVIRGEILEIIDDSRKWWKARNWRGQIAHVPHTIVQEINGSTNNNNNNSNNRDRERDLHMGNSSPNDDWIRRERQERSALINEIVLHRSDKDNEEPLYSVPYKSQIEKQEEQKYQQQNYKTSRENSINQIPVPPPLKQSYLAEIKKYEIKNLAENLHHTNINEREKNFSLNSRKSIDLDDDTSSIKSQRSSFHEELAATLRNRKQGLKEMHKITEYDENGNEKSKENSEEDKQTLTFATIIEHLHRKNFHPRLISKLTAQKNNYRDMVKFLMTATKQQLREIIPNEIGNETELQRLHSNFTILKNSYSYEPSQELDSKLNERRNLYD